MPKNQAPIRFGIIACSSIAQRRFLPALKSSGAARLERVGSREAERARSCAEQFGVEKFGGYEEVLKDPEVDAVYISTPAVLHREWALKAAAHKKHILCEKPACISHTAALEVARSCQENGVEFMEGYSFLFHPQHALVRSLVESGRVGRLLFFQAQFTYPRPPEGDIRLQPELKGGVFFDSAGYGVASAVLAFDQEPVSVHCRIVADEALPLDRAVSMELEFGGGGIAQCFTGFGLHYRSSYAVHGTKGRIEVPRAFSVPSNWSAVVKVEIDDHLEEQRIEPADQFGLMLETFCGRVTGESRSDAGREALLRQARIMEAAEKSHLENRIVVL